jgi:hypothetical protein
MGCEQAEISGAQVFASKQVTWPAGQAIEDAHSAALAAHVLSGHATGVSAGQAGGQSRKSTTHDLSADGHSW